MGGFSHSYLPWLPSPPSPQAPRLFHLCFPTQNFTARASQPLAEDTGVGQVNVLAQSQQLSGQLRLSGTFGSFPSSTPALGQRPGEWALELAWNGMPFLWHE